jgi:CheY-like chemotaxis protein
VVVLGAISVIQSVGSISELARSRMGNTAASLAGGLDRVLYDQLIAIRNISFANSVITAAEQASAGQGGTDNSEIHRAQEFISRIKDAEGDRLSSIFITGREGLILASSDLGKHQGLDVSDRQYFHQALRGEPVLGEIVYSKATGRAICMAAHPIYAFDRKTITGVAVLALQLPYITRLVDEVRAGETGYAFIVDRSGMYLTHPVKQNVLTVSIAQISGMGNMLAESGRGNRGIVEYELDGTDKIAAYAPVPSTGWTVVNTVNTDELYASAIVTRNVIAGTGLAFFLLAGLFFLFFSRNLTRPVIQLADASRQIAAGRLDIEVDGKNRLDELGILARSFQDMAGSLAKARVASERNDWLKTGLTRLNEVMQGDPEVGPLGARAISEMVDYLGAQIGGLYVLNADGDRRSVLSLAGSYAYPYGGEFAARFRLGEGLVGQAALARQQIVLRNVPEDYVKITSGQGERTPRFVCLTPFLYEGRVKGVVELGALDELSERQIAYLSLAMPALGVAVESAQKRAQLALAYEEQQRINEELQVQQEELRTTNEELEEHTRRLRESEEKLRAQQEELRVTNEELEEKNDLLEHQKKEVEAARSKIQHKAEEVALASRYKSEFLANMSHELRTPLNSLLLLAQNLARNSSGNLTPEQIESAKIIYEGGSDLLNLINDILDLSKIESGRMDLVVTQASVAELSDRLQGSFDHVAREKGLALSVQVEPQAPLEISTDIKRLEQILRNLVSNAIKFTETGAVTITLGRPAAIPPDGDGLGPDPTESDPTESEKMLSIAVKDTGIGIEAKDWERVFDAFQQVDGSTARKYGGTGLGLSISRELAHLLGGEIRLESQPGKGSTFTLLLPVTARKKPKTFTAPPAAAGRGQRPTIAETPEARPFTKTSSIADDRETLSQGDHVILIIEDDPRFAKVLSRQCHERRFKCLTANTGEEGLALARQHLPDGIVLDIRMPGMDGWAVLSTLKDDIRTRHIPVHVISVEETAGESLRKGAIGHATKPISREQLDQAFTRLGAVWRETKRVLLVEDDETVRTRIRQLIEEQDIQVDDAATGGQALTALREKRYGCMILDLVLPDMNGAELLDRMEQECPEPPPVIIHTSRELTEQEELLLREHADSIVIKDVRSQERLLDEVSLFLHRMVGRMPEKKKQIIRNLHETDAILAGKTVLIVDDDMRTTFALSRLLAERGMKPLKAGNGEQALKALEQETSTDLVLMDIMMPVMDGYETIKRIRDHKRFRKLPIIALTAKAMPEDRSRCIEAGASDYLPKPVDADRLISMMRVWLYR